MSHCWKSHVAAQYYEILISSQSSGVFWAASRQNRSSGFLTKPVSNQYPQLQRLARKLKFHLKEVYIRYFPKSE